MSPISAEVVCAAIVATIVVLVFFLVPRTGQLGFGRDSGD